jgi:hypothetical protein
MTTGGAIMGQDVTVTAVGGPFGEPNCGATMVMSSTISLEPQTGCMFSNVTVSAGSVDMTSGNPIVWTSGNNGMITFMFNITCP